MRIEHWIYTIPLRFRSLFHRSKVERDLDDELQYHLDKKAEYFVARGLSAKAARRAALREMGGLTQQKEACRDFRRLNFIDNAIQDIRYSVRVLSKSRGFTAVAVGTLALAIGANAVVFGVLNGLILRPVDVPNPDSLYGLEHGNEHSMYQSYPDYLDLRARNRTFEDLIGFNFVEAAFDTGDSVARTWGESVTSNYFDALGLKPYLGRFFHSSDEHGLNSAPYLVLSYTYWHTHFLDDPGVVGRTVELNKRPFTILGVARPEFHGIMVFGSSGFFLPMVNQEAPGGASELTERGHQAVFMTLGHLKPGVTPVQAAADLDSVGAWLDRTYPKEHGKTTFKLARPGLYGNYLGGPVKSFLSALLLLAGLILLAACANLGSLFAARASDRSREIALRLALGAKRNRILRTLFTEAVLISLMGGTVGLWGSVELLNALSKWQVVPKFPVRVPVTPDAKVYLVALLLALASALLFGVVPMRQVLRVNAYQVVKAGPGGMLGRRFAIRDLLLVAQIAICAVLVTASIVAGRGLERSMGGLFGFDPRHVMLADMNLGMVGYRDAAVPVMQKKMIDAVSTIPGVECVGLIDSPPLYNGGANDATLFKDETVDLRRSNAAALAPQYRISPDYLRAAGTALLAGRTFSWHDDQDAPRVALLNRLLAVRLFGSPAKAPGKFFKVRDFKTGGAARVQVVGVVEDGKYVSLAEDQLPAVFFPFQQSLSGETALVVRSHRDPIQLGAALRATLRGVDSALPATIETWNQALDIALFPPRVATVSLGVLGVLGAMLSISGIFGMAAYSVSRRLRELGIRIALGAQRREVLHAALGRALQLLAFGSAAGMALGLLATRVLGAIVYHATPRDPVVLVGAVMAMLLLGLFATWIPARRALSLDPAALLREE